MENLKYHLKIARRFKLFYFLIAIMFCFCLGSCKSSKKKEVNKKLLNYKEGNYYRTSDSYYKDILGTWISKENGGKVKIIFKNAKVFIEGETKAKDIYADVLSGYYCYKNNNSEDCTIQFSKESLIMRSDTKEFVKNKKADFYFTDNLTKKAGLVSFNIADKDNAI